MSSLGSTVSSTVGGSETGASAGSSFGGWGALVGGLLGGAGGLASGLLSSGGNSTAQMLSMFEKYYQPTKAGWSWAQLENQLAIEQFRKQLDSSAQTDLNLSRAMNEQLPLAQVTGLKAAGLNPILAVLGSGFSPIQSSASASMSGGARLPGGFSSGIRRVNSAGSAADFAKIIGGVIDADVDNRKADTDVKKTQVGNIKATNDLIRAQAYKTEQEGDQIRDLIQHGKSWYSDFGREIRSGFGEHVENATSWLLDLFGYGSPDAVKPGKVSESSGHSAKNPGITLEVDLSRKQLDKVRDRYKDLPSINEYIKHKYGD